jgi:hypothetical protein
MDEQRGKDKESGREGQRYVPQQQREERDERKEREM